ncbi:uncharacterized protein C8A04DRAFT_32567 [Dichotomopilus funicola]|uniref:Transmembrane protein 53 n=1 Tax=Dichotomopilus funicola TaxID=1934379 RepID=A0AAN6ZJQ6_9PEZI|nr:hypothetical protein C8A04DRAFT_32567 [Dichotomopilus funicola]
MASNSPATPPSRPLGSMTRLAPCVYIYRPESPAVATSEDLTPASSKRTPKLIILATWMGARDPHIAKYLVQYQALFPTAPILLLRSEARHFLRPGGNDREFVAAVPFVRSIFPEIGTSTTASSNTVQPELHLHAWSNGGAASLHHLRAGLCLPASGTTSTSNTNTNTLPPYTLLLDSSPGTFRYGPAYLAFTAGLTGRTTRFLLAPVFHALCAWYWLIHVVIGRGKTGPLAVVGAALNWNGGGDNDGNGKGKGVAQAELRRTYVYGEGDKLVDWRDVEAHAAEAERKGFMVRREKFEGSAHVAHVRVDADRYWRVVTETWEGVE